MKLVTYNIQFSLGLDNKFDLGRIAHAVQDGDIIALQEVEKNWGRTNNQDQPEVLSALLPDHYWSYFPALDLDASVKTEQGIQNRRRQFGPMIMSKYPILSTRYITFPMIGTASWFNMVTGAIECIIDAPNGHLRVVSLHLGAISPRERLMQIDTLMEFHRTAYTTGGAWTGDALGSYSTDWSDNTDAPTMPIEAIVMGDFNSTPDSKEYARMTGDCDPHTGGIDQLDSFVDAWPLVNGTPDSRITWINQSEHSQPNSTLDYCFISPRMATKVVDSWVDDNATGSDHKPLWTEIQL